MPSLSQCSKEWRDIMLDSAIAKGRTYSMFDLWMAHQPLLILEPRTREEALSQAARQFKKIQHEQNKPANCTIKANMSKIPQAY